MHKYNTLYTRKLSWHVLTPTSLYENSVEISITHYEVYFLSVASTAPLPAISSLK